MPRPFSSRCCSFLWVVALSAALSGNAVGLDIASNYSQWVSEEENAQVAIQEYMAGLELCNGRTPMEFQRCADNIRAEISSRFAMRYSAADFGKFVETLVTVQFVFENIKGPAKLVEQKSSRGLVCVAHSGYSLSVGPGTVVPITCR